MSRDWSNRAGERTGDETDQGWSGTDIYVFVLLVVLLVSALLSGFVVAHWVLVGGLI